MAPVDISPAWLAWAGIACLDLLAEIGIASIHRHDLGSRTLRDGRSSAIHIVTVSTRAV
jgi:hypothetical protein